MNNYLKISGTVENNNIVSIRTSGTADTIPVEGITPEHTPLTIVGQFRSRNTPDRHVQLYIETCGYLPYTPNTNEITLTGYVCKSPVYRTTPGGRIITDILLAVTRPFEQSDYIPCIAWNGLGKDLQIGDKITVKGRVQSRTHRKGISYEVSIDTLNLEC